MDSNENGAIEITVIINIIIILLLLFFIKQHLQKECMCSCARQAFSQRLKFGHQVRFFAIKLSEITWCVFFELQSQATMVSISYQKLGIFHRC